MIIRPVHADDFGAILRINAEAAPHVAKLDHSELRRLLACARIAWVAQSADRVSGYLFAMSSSDEYDGEEFRSFRQRFEQPFVYVDQIAIARNEQGKGFASLLYEHLGRWTSDHGYLAMCCEVNLKPPNPSSMRFHFRLGFQPLAELETADGRSVALLVRVATHART